jgi:hypothetical protein
MNKTARLYRQHGFNPAKGPDCPYCQEPSVLRPASEIYNKGDRHFDGSLWVCRNYPTCNSYVGTHKHGTLKDYPLGSLANEELRTARKAVHNVFDLIYKRNLMTREEAYRWMEKEMFLSKEEAHIGEMDIFKCNMIYTRVLKYLSGEYIKMEQSRKPTNFNWL